MRQFRLVPFMLAAFLMPAAADAALLQAVSPGQWTIAITDGSSNTILFGETGSLDICIPAALAPTNITDGSSQTLLFGEQGLVVTVSGSAPGRTAGTQCLTDVRDPRPVGGITDGTSNTIVFGETPVELCFSNVRVGTITDGTSNTILFGETSSPCYQDVQVGPGLRVQAVPAPAVLTLLSCALTAAFRRRRPPSRVSGTPRGPAAGDARCASGGTPATAVR